MPETKKRIFNEAARLFAEKGFDRVPVREIGAAASTNDSAIYRYFNDKADILDGILDEFLHRLKRYLLTPEKVDAWIETDTPRKLLSRCIGRFEENESDFMGWAYRIVCMEQLTNQKAREIITGQLHQETARSIRYVLDQLAARGEIPAYDTRFFAELWAQLMFSGSVLWMYGFPDGAAEAKAFYAVNERMIDLALSGRLPPGEERHET